MIIFNKFYKSNFELIEEFEAGIILTGGEVKSARNNGVRLEHGFIRIIDGVPLLYNVEIAHYKYDTSIDKDINRIRKLLLTKKQIIYIYTKLKSGKAFTLIPTKLFTKNNKIKLTVALSRGKKNLDKKKLEKEKTNEKNERKTIKDEYGK